MSENGAHHLTGLVAADGPAPVKLAGGQRLSLSDPDRLWVVESGQVEVYYVERHRTHGAGTRRFLLNATAGDILVGFGAEIETLDVEVFAIGFDAWLRAVQPEQFVLWLRQEENESVADALLAKWIDQLASRVVVDRSIVRHGTLPIGEIVILPANESVRSDQRVCWVEKRSGSCTMLGRSELHLRDDEPWPVTGDLWLLPDQAGTSLLTSSTLELCERHDPIQITAACNSRVLEVLVGDERNAASAERERLRAKTEAEARLSEHAYDVLGNVLTGRGALSGDTAPLTASPLLEAARRVGAEVGLEIEPPLDTGDGSRVTMRDPVEAIARSSKVRTRKVLLRGEWWKRDNGPLLAFVEEDSKPLALIWSGRSRYVVHDPTNKEIEPLSAETAASLRATAYMFFPSFGKERITPKYLWKMGLRGVGKDLQSVILLSAITGLMALATPILSQILFDEIVPQADRGQLPIIAIVLFVFAIVGSALGLVRGLVLLRVEAKVELNMEGALMDRLLRLPATFFSKYLAGDLAQRVLGIATIRSTLTGTTLTAILSGFFSIISLGLLVYYSATLALLGVALAIVVVSVILASSLIALKYNRQLTEWAGQISGLVLELMTSVSKLRVAAAEERAFAVWAEKFAQQRQCAYRAGEIQNNFQIFQAAYPIITSMLFFGVMYVVTEGAAAGQAPITPGVFIAVIGAFGQFLGGMLGLGGTVISVINVVPYYERLLPILEAEPETGVDRVDPGLLGGGIEINDVTFRYADDGPVILNDISLNVNPGEMVALVGPSGSGKSTLVRLLLGFEQPESGTVCFDGRDLTGLDLDGVRQQCGVVPQHGQLAEGDIMANIVGPWNLTLDEAWAAARAVGLEEDIRDMPMGMHTLVSEDGGTFSGGQRQRLMIARAIVHEPSILLLDEATSALDNRTQRVVSESLERMNVTRVVVAHRLSTIQEADRIYVLESGRIVESGTYESLLEQDGHFADLAKRQLL